MPIKPPVQGETKAGSGGRRRGGGPPTATGSVPKVCNFCPKQAETKRAAADGGRPADRLRPPAQGQKFVTVIQNRPTQVLPVARRRTAYGHRLRAKSV